MGAFAFHFGSGFWHGTSRLQKMLLKHFGGSAGEIATAGRQFPITARVDIQAALEELLKTRPESKLLGVLSPHHGASLPALADMLAGEHFPINEGPLQHDEIDIGGGLPVRCLKNGLWLSRDNGLPFAVMMTPGGRFGTRSGVQVEIGIPAGERGGQFSQELFRDLELLVAKGRTYRGRIISLEGHIDHRGGGSMVKVHRLAKVARENVILPARTLALLDRNVTGFMQARQQLTALAFQAKKDCYSTARPARERRTRFTIWPRNCRVTLRCW